VCGFGHEQLVTGIPALQYRDFPTQDSLKRWYSTGRFKLYSPLGASGEVRENSKNPDE